VKILAPIGELTRKDFLDRRTLLDALRQCRPQFGQKRAGLWDHQYLAASDLLMGENTGAAFDLEKEDPKTRDHYGRNRSGQTALLARRLVEAGVTFVTVIDPGVGLSSSGWDLHKKLAWGTKTASPRMDQAVTALIQDLHVRGLDKKVLVVVWGEFGRTPIINKNAGRDHWAGVQSVMVAGGNYQHGQVIGSSTSRGETPPRSSTLAIRCRGHHVPPFGHRPAIYTDDLSWSHKSAVGTRRGHPRIALKADGAESLALDIHFVSP